MAQSELEAPETRFADGELGRIEGLADDALVFGHYAREGRYAPELLQRLCALVAGASAQPGTLIDVGAHIGLVSIGVTTRTGASCLAIEPAPRNARLLQGNVERLGLASRIEVHACALDAQPGTVELALSRENSGDHHLLARASERGATDASTCVRVPATTLDALLEGRAPSSPVVLKLDTQGAEARVLRGATRALARVDHAVIEYWPYGLHRMGEAPGALDALLCASFPYAAVLEPGLARTKLAPTAEELHRLRWIARDGSDQGFFDVLFSRSPVLTDRERGTSAPR